MPALNEFLLREENQLQLRERGIPINQAKLKFFEQSGDESSQNRISTILEKFAQDFLPQNSSENLFDWWRSWINVCRFFLIRIDLIKIFVDRLDFSAFELFNDRFCISRIE